MTAAPGPRPSTIRGGLTDRHIAFVAALREAGIAVSVAEDLDAAAVLRAVELTDREQLRAGYAAALVKRHTQRGAFDTIFELFYPARLQPAARAGEPGGAAEHGDDRDGSPAERPPIHRDTELAAYRAELADALLDGDEAGLRQLADLGVAMFGTTAGRGSAGGTGTRGAGWSRYLALNRISPDTLLAGLLARLARGAGAGEGDNDEPLSVLAERNARAMLAQRIRTFTNLLDVAVQRRLAAASSPQQVARTAVRPAIEQVDLSSATRADLVAIRREIQPLARRLAARLAIEQRRGRRGPLDFRATVRASLSSGGVPVRTVHRPPRPHKTDLVVLCDVSESVTAFAQFTLLLVYALREQFSRVRVFAFVDELDEVTRFFGPGIEVGEAVTRLASEASVRGWSGRTDYGRVFGLFGERYLDAITPRTSLLILGDARSNYGELALPALQWMTERARRSYWLNPERRALWNTGDSVADRFGAQVAMVECRNLAQLSAFVRDLV